MSRRNLRLCPARRFQINTSISHVYETGCTYSCGRNIPSRVTFKRCTNICAGYGHGLLECAASVLCSNLILANLESDSNNCKHDSTDSQLATLQCHRRFPSRGAAWASSGGQDDSCSRDKQGLQPTGDLFGPGI